MDSEYIVTWDQAKARLGFTDNNQQEKVEPLLGWVTELAQSIIGRELFKKERTLLTHGKGTPQLFLPVSPLESVHSLYIDNNNIFDENTLVDPSEYIINEKGGYVELLNYNFPKKRNNVKIVYTSGWNSGEFPYDINKACLDCLQSTWNKIVNNSYGIKSITQTDGTNATFDYEVPFLAKQCFESYAWRRV